VIITNMQVRSMSNANACINHCVCDIRHCWPENRWQGAGALPKPAQFSCHAGNCTRCMAWNGRPPVRIPFTCWERERERESGSQQRWRCLSERTCGVCGIRTKYSAYSQFIDFIGVGDPQYQIQDPWNVGLNYETLAITALDPLWKTA
jgi:hypothetical protein